MASFLDVVKGFLTGGAGNAPSTNKGYGSLALAPLPGEVQAVGTVVHPSTQGNIATWGTGAQGVSYPSQVHAANTNSAGLAYNPESYGSTASSAAAQAAAQQQAALSSSRNDALSRINSLLNAYNSLNGSLTSQYQDEVGRDNANYDQQLGDLNKTYGDTTQQTSASYGARGIGDSSYLGNALSDLGSTYQSNVNSIGQSRQSDLGQLGSAYSGNKAQIANAMNQYNQEKSNIGNYDATDLSTLLGNLQTDQGNVAAQGASTGPLSQFVNVANSLSPTQNQGSSQLQSKLQQLIGSNTPTFAKNQIAQGLINSNDPSQNSYWTNYYNQLLGQSG